MDSNPPPNNGGPPADCAKKKNSNKRKDSLSQILSKATITPQNVPVKNAPKEQKKPSQSNEPKPTVKTQEVPQNQSKAKDDFPQISKATNRPQNEPVKSAPKEQNQSKKQKKPSQSNEPKQTAKTQEVPQKQSKAKDDFPQMSIAKNMPQNEPVKNAPKEQNQSKKQKKPNQSNEQKPTAKTQEVPQKQSKGNDNFPQMSKSSMPQNKSTQNQSNVSAKTPEEGKISQQQNQNCQPQLQQIIEIFKNKITIPKRSNPKAGGKKGRATEIDVNHLPLNLDKLFTKTVYHIDVLFKPELPRRLLRNALEEFNHRHYPNVQFAFDGRRNMYTTKEIKSKSDVISILNEENNRSIEFTIVTTVVKKISMVQIKEYLSNGSSNSPPGEAFQALDIVLKNRPFSLRFTNIGRSFFPVPRITPVDLGEGMELWKGFFQSPVMGWKPYLNIDVAHKGFPKYQPLISYIQNEMRFNPHSEMDRWNMEVLLNYIKGLKVDFLVPNQPNTKRSYKVIGLLNSAANFYFCMENGVELNVVQYFQKTRNYTIKYPNLPCLHVGKVQKKTAVPIELCTVTRGQLRMKKLTEMQTAVMVKNAARPPAERRQTIENCIKNIRYNEDPVLKEFGIEVKEYLATVPARVLEQPSLSYWQDKETKPRSGVWRADKFSKSVILSKWVVFNLDERTNMSSIKNFENGLIRSGVDLNVTVHSMYPVKNHFLRRNCRLSEIQVEITNFFNKAKADGMELIVVIIPDGPAGVYATVKQSSELVVGVLTQCIKSKTMFRMNPSTASNILLKINSKLNGINHTLKNRPISMKDAIIFGADVSHPSPDQTDIPSVAAVAASHDIHGSQYNMEWRLQDPKVEIIQELEDIVHKQLCKFRERTNIVPKKIIYFRDGVSEGQFLQLLNEELVAIRRACLRLNIKYTPTITFLVVQKRHHTRMFPKHNIDMDGKFCNIPSGTIVDTHITHPTEIDFYLCSHASIQGTARPSKYHLLWDDNGFNEDELEQLTFHLCFMFARCTRSVSYPAPTYYAHLAAFRARSYIENKTINLNRLGDEQVKNTLNTLFTKTNPMFFV